MITAVFFRCLLVVCDRGGQGPPRIAAISDYVAAQTARTSALPSAPMSFSP
jgi:hypothetical protein